MNAEPMVRRCFRRQHPEAFGREEVTEPSVPVSLRFGPGEVHAPGAVIPEEPMGGPDHEPEVVPIA